MIHYRELKKKTLQKIVKKIKALENQIEGLKKENQVFKEILTSKLAINNGNNNNIDNSWKTVKANQVLMSTTKTTTGNLILLTSEINFNLSLSTKMK